MIQSYKKLFLILAAGIALYSVFVLPSFKNPLVADDVFFSKGAAEFVKGNVYCIHPPLYVSMLGFSNKLFGAAGKNLRFLGFACFLAVLFTALKAGDMADETSAAQRSLTGVIACFLYIINPMALRGTLILDIDNTILPVLLLAALILFIKFNARNKLRDMVLLSIVISLVFWAKLSAPVMFLAAVIIFLFLENGFVSVIKKGIIIAVLPVLFFTAGWFAASRLLGADFFEIIYRTADVFVTGTALSAGISPVNMLAHLAKVIFWVGPFTLALFVVFVIYRFSGKYTGGKNPLIEFCILFAILIFAGYLVIGGTIFQFPKYHYPMVILICIVNAYFIQKTSYELSLKNLAFAGALLAVLVIYNMFFIGDTLYLITRRLREIMIFKGFSLREARGILGGSLLLYSAALIFSFITVKLLITKKSYFNALTVTFFILGCADNISVDILQAKADYSTTYCYGRKFTDMEKLSAFMTAYKKVNPRAAIIGPEDLLETAGIDVKHPYCYIGKNSERFLTAIRGKNTKVVVYSSSWNDSNFFRNIITDKAVADYIKKEFKNESIGEYKILIKK